MVFIHKSNLPNLLKVKYRKTEDFFVWKKFFRLSGLGLLGKKVGVKKIELVRAVFSLASVLLGIRRCLLVLWPKLVQ